MKRYLTAAVAVTVAIVTLLLLPLGAGASANKRFVLAIRGQLATETTGAGTFSVGGAISDAGPFDVSFSATPAAKGNCYSITGDWTFTATAGSFTFHGSGSSCSPSPGDSRAIADITFKITDATGAYTGLSGKGTATGETDFNDGTFTTVFDGKAH